MNRHLLTYVLAATSFVAGCSGPKLKGTVEGYRYTAPGGELSVMLTPPGPPQDVVEDEVSGGTIMVRQREMYGGVNRVEAQKLTADELARLRKVGLREALPAHFDESVLPLLQKATGNRGEIMERRLIPGRATGGEAYYVAMRFPGMGEPDRTGQATDHYRGYLLQLREPYLLLVTRSRNLAASYQSISSELYTQTVSFARGIEVEQ
jgi:hypothetical protein